MNSIDFTSGTSWKQILGFAIPLMLGNFFQLTYNVCDSIIVGRFASKEALAAIGTSDSILTLLTLAVSGICIGASVLMSQFFGAHQFKEMQEEFSTLLCMGSVFGMIVMILGLLSCEMILKSMNVPYEILSSAKLYLNISFSGLPFIVLYNICSSGLRSISNAKIPTLSLILSSITNIGLDLLFVCGFSWSVFGAGLATVLSQALSFFICLFYIQRKEKRLKMSFVCKKEYMYLTMRYGFFSALQQCAQPIGKLCIQGMVNSLGIYAMAAFNAIGKIEDIGLVPGRTLSDAMMTFVAQNKGANQEKRMEKGFKEGMFLEFVFGLCISFLLFCFRKPLMSLFTDNESIIYQGISYFSVMFIAYALSNLANGNQGYFRGIGKMKITLLGTITQISIRTIASFIWIEKYCLKGVGFACMTGWIVQFIWQWLYHYKYIKKSLS
ncbi:MATE family efflux transporter [Floccifex sp.]|uniref:MATE family efflux transporter n=1 Tax=Floccifex sp. TaxID=2815810 RepID=UPI003F0EE265